MSRDLPAWVTPVSRCPSSYLHPQSSVDMPPVEGDSEVFTAENDEETEKYMNVDEDTVMDAKTANRNLAAEIAALLAEGEEEGILKGCVDEGLDSWE